MNDKYLIPTVTENGLSLLIRSLHGETITFTKLVLGNGTPSNLDDVEQMDNPLLEIPFTSIEAKGTYLMLVGETTSASIDASFYGKELGVYAKDESGTEYLYAYRYTETADYFPSKDEGHSIELRITVIVQVGNAKNVEAILTEGDAYASKKAFEEHLEDTNNPHQVTKEQVGLENVENKSINDLTPTFVANANLVNIESDKDTVSVILGKLKTALARLISHLDNGTIHIKQEERAKWNNKAEGNHNHSTSNITSGTLGIARGGTGVTSYSDLVDKLGLGNSKMSLDFGGNQEFMFRFDGGIQFYAYRNTFTCAKNSQANYGVNFPKAFKFAPICIATPHVRNPKDIDVSVCDTTASTCGIGIYNETNKDIELNISIFVVGRFK